MLIYEDYSAEANMSVSYIQSTLILSSNMDIFFDHSLWNLTCSSLLLLQDAICTLNTLQTNASALEQVRRERSNPQVQLQAMRGFLERAGIAVS